ncbi:MAG TPA: glycosyltransferase family 4 protein [Caulobacteraceae bacterium]|nr:glycosyltransferase family 4 protein [Caulobacteraceae bacterium]
MTSKTKLLMTTDAVGGVWTYALDLAASLAPMGIETTLAVMGPPPSPAQRLQAREVKGLALIETGLALDWTAAGPREVLVAGKVISDLARMLSSDLVQLNSPAMAAGAIFPCPIIGVCHSCLATWWSSVRSGPAPEDFRWRTMLMGNGLTACDLLAAPSRAFALQIAAAYGVAAPRVVHNGRSPRPTGSFKQPIILASGRLWDEGKNVGVLDRAAALCKAPVFAAGPLQAPTGAARVEPRNIVNLGLLSTASLDSWLARSRIYVSTALYEPFGLGVLEAAQSGCALVLADIPTFRELWDGAALFADPRSPEAFARCFDELIEDEASADFLGAKAEARAARFSPERMARAMLGLFRAARSRVEEGAAA